MKFFRGVVGYTIAGMIVMSVWGPLTTFFSGSPASILFGGIFAAFFIIGPMWFMNHFLGLVHHSSDSAFVDMGLAIGICGTMRDVFMSNNGMQLLVDTIPTLGLVIVGAIAGGIVSGLILKDMAND